METHLRQQIHAFDQQQLQRGSPFSVALKTADITLGPDGRDVAKLDFAGQLAVTAFLQKVSLDIQLSLEGQPVYVSKENAIYIRRLALLDSKIESPMFKAELAPATEQVMAVIAQLLETTPVYRLDESDLAGQLLQLANMDLKVAPGKLVFVPAN